MVFSKLIALGCSVSMLTTIAFATDSDTPESRDSSNIAEILVTATRRKTTLEQTPISISFIGQETIDQHRIVGLSDVAELTPGLVFTPLSRQQSYPSIRGTTRGGSAAGSDSGVSVFIDDVPTTGVGDDDIDLFDLQSIQVLRGPQGTLFGRNTTGGAILLQTLPPSMEYDEKAQLTYGRFNLAELRAFITGPLVDNTLAGKVVVEARRQDGYVHDPYLARQLLSTQLGGVRGQLLWNPNKDVRVLFGADYNVDRSPYKVAQLYGNFQPSLFPRLGYSPEEADQGVPSSGNARTGGAFARVDYSVPIGTLTSISGYRSVNDLAIFSSTADPPDELIQNAVEKDNQFTEEIRFTSSTAGKFNWLAGTFLLAGSRTNYGDYNVSIVPGTVVSFAPPYKALNYSSIAHQHIYDHSYSAFGEASYAFTPVWALTLGGRYTWERKTGHTELTDTSGLSAPLISGDYGHTWTAFTPKVSLKYTPSHVFLGYLTVEDGFKSGGYDVSGITVAGLQTPFKPERVRSFEAGFKLSLLSDRLIVNADGYRADYKDLQLQVFDQVLLQSITQNAGIARIPGTEVEVFAKPMPWLDLNLGYSYTGAYYTQYTNGSTNFAGHQIPYQPKNQGHAGGEVHWVSSTLGGTVRFGGEVAYASSFYIRDANNDLPFFHDKTPVKGDVNLHASWASPGEHWEWSLWGRNITDRRHIINATSLAVFYETLAERKIPSNTMYLVSWNQPAMYGISFTYHLQ